VRHGETEGQSSVRFHGKGDVRLSDEGREQVRRLLPLLRDVPFHAVLHSPLSRAAESARILVAGLARPPAAVVGDPALAEVDFGAIEGMTREEIVRAFPAWSVEWQAGTYAGFPGGETLADFTHRVVDCFSRLLARYPAGDVLVVAHRGVIRRAAEALVGRPGDYGTDLGTLSVLRLEPAVEVVRWNWPTATVRADAT
jgi:broad specificity phosphatase PhoE